MITVLAGGFGAARFLRGLCRVVPPTDVTVVGNTGDDIEVYGVHVSPDLDIVTFMLGGVLDEERQFGIAGDTHHVMDELRALGVDPWFSLGDRDHAVCAARTGWLRDGVPLHRCAEDIARRFGVAARILPMTDDPAPTTIVTDCGPMHFQEYWVRRRAEPSVRRIDLSRAEDAAPAPGVLASIRHADAVVIAPSNPAVSIAPILAVRDVRDALRQTRAPVVGVSPIIGGRVVRGMADRLIPAIGVECSARGVAELYADLIDGWVIDRADEELAPAIACSVEVTHTLMRTPEDAAALAKTTLSLAERLT